MKYTYPSTLGNVVSEYIYGYGGLSPEILPQIFNMGGRFTKYNCLPFRQLLTLCVPFGHMEIQVINSLFFL